MSRPSWSVPSGWLQLGRWKVWVWSAATGFWGARMAARAATTRRIPTIIAPTRAVLFLRSRRKPCARGDCDWARTVGQTSSPTAGSSLSPTLPPLMSRPIDGSGPSTLAILASSSGVADARVEERVGQIDKEIDHDEGECRDQGEGLHLLVVAGEDGVDAEGAEARHREQRLDHDRAADQKADLEPHHRHRRDQGVL